MARPTGDTGDETTHDPGSARIQFSKFRVPPRRDIRIERVGVGRHVVGIRKRVGVGSVRYCVGHVAVQLHVDNAQVGSGFRGTVAASDEHEDERKVEAVSHVAVMPSPAFGFDRFEGERYSSRRRRGN